MAVSPFPQILFQTFFGLDTVKAKLSAAGSLRVGENNPNYRNGKYKRKGEASER